MSVDGSSRGKAFRRMDRSAFGMFSLCSSGRKEGTEEPLSFLRMLSGFAPGLVSSSFSNAFVNIRRRVFLTTGFSKILSAVLYSEYRALRVARSVLVRLNLRSSRRTFRRIW